MKFSLYFITITVLLLSAIVGWAQPKQPDPAPKPNPEVSMMSGMACPCPMCGMDMMGHGKMSHNQIQAYMRAIGLSDDQMNQLLNIFLDFAKTQARLSGEVKAAQVDLAQKFLQDNVDRKQVEGQIQQISRLQGDLQLAGIRALLDAREVLTPEQRKKLISILLAGPHPQMPMGPGMQPGGAPPQPPAGQH